MKKKPSRYSSVWRCRWLLRLLTVTAFSVSYTSNILNQFFCNVFRVEPHLEAELERRLFLHSLIQHLYHTTAIQRQTRFTAFIPAQSGWASTRFIEKNLSSFTQDLGICKFVRYILKPVQAQINWRFESERPAGENCDVRIACDCCVMHHGLHAQRSWTGDFLLI